MNVHDLLIQYKNIFQHHNAYSVYFYIFRIHFIH